MNYQEMDQNHWVCYQFPDKTYYYGEVGYLDQGGVVLSKDNAQAAANTKNKLVKHGFGIYIYDVKTQGKASKYQGSWDRDKKNGQGKLIIPGQFTYQGSFKDGSYHQYGKMSWSNGDSYEGNWKKNRMQGGGLFKHHEGFVLKGSFKGNHFIDDNILRNPQMSEKQYTLFKKQRKQIIKQKERNQKIKHGFIMKLSIDDIDKLVEICSKSNKNNRIPLIIASQESKFNIQTLQKTFNNQGNVNIFDLRKAFTLQAEDKYNYKMKFGEMTRKTLKQGGSLVINLDQSQVQYKQAFYPDLKEFYDTNGFNNNTWKRQLIKRPEIYQKLIGSAPNDDYSLLIWSKVKLGESLNQQKIREKIQLRFESIIPFIRVDIIFIITNK